MGMSGDPDDVELTKDDKRTLKQLLADYRDSSVTRRAAMGGTAAILGGAAVGAGRVTAQPDGSPSVIGKETDRTDLWGDQIDANVVDTEIATITNADGSTIDGDDIVGIPNTSSGVGLSFDTWRQADANRPALIILRVKVVTDGTTNGKADVRVDESGGTAGDYFLTIFADSNQGSNAQDVESVSLIIPAGAQYVVDNDDDPNNANTIQTAREVIL